MKKFKYNFLYNIEFANNKTKQFKLKSVMSRQFPYKIETVAENLYVPWSIDISDEGKIYFTERSGTIKVIENGKLNPEPLITFGGTFVSQGEGGLLGIALDPAFSRNHYIYAMHSYLENNKIYNRIVRLIEKDNKAYIDTIIIDSIPGGQIHNGGRIKIGPDNKLYNSPVYSLGHRNPQGLAWNSKNMLYESEHGQIGHDEINIIHPGANYGWPLVQGDEESINILTQKPLINSGESTWAPSGIDFVNQGPWNRNLLISNLRGQQLLDISLNEEGTKVNNIDFWLKNEYGRLREVIQSKDGSIYIATSNRDGRGNPDITDDRIIRLTLK